MEILKLEELPDSAPATALFPRFASVYDMVATEVEGLTPQQLDFESDRWEWSKWSIRRQVSHMASLQFRWMINRLGEHIFPEGFPPIEDLEDLVSDSNDRRLDESKYWEIEVLLDKLLQAIDLVQAVLARETVGSFRSKEVVTDYGSGWQLTAPAHPRGWRLDPQDPTRFHMTLEAAFRHMYYEDITHVYNIQRLRRAQGLSSSVELPQEGEGYWLVPGWNRSEP